jgi:hypothetical protein
MQKKVESSVLLKFQIDQIKLLQGFEPPHVRKAILSIIEKFDSMDCIIEEAQEEATLKAAKSGIISGIAQQFAPQSNKALNQILTGGEFTDGESFAPLSTLLSDTFGEVLGLFIELINRGKDNDCIMKVESQEFTPFPKNPSPAIIPGLPVSQIPPQNSQYTKFPVTSPSPNNKANPGKRSFLEIFKIWEEAQKEYAQAALAQEEDTHPQVMPVQDVPRHYTPQEVPRHYTPQEIPRHYTPQEIPRVQTPQEIPRVQTPKEAPKGHAKKSYYINPDYVPPQRNAKKRKGCKCTGGCDGQRCLCVRLHDYCNNNMECDCIGCCNIKPDEISIEV